jgi:hypothetical protein
MTEFDPKLKPLLVSLRFIQTEWAEDFADWIPKHVTSYLNLDSTGAGTTFGVGSSYQFFIFFLSHQSRRAE